MRHLELKGKLAALALSLTEREYSARGFALDVRLSPDQLVAAVSELDEAGFFIEAITGVDWLGEQAALRKEATAKAAAEAKAAIAAAEAAGEEAPPQPLTEDGELPPDELEAVYDFNRYQSLFRVTLRVRAPRTDPEIPSISEIYPGANWHEREAHDFFGIRFTGHPCLVPLLLPEDADFHPLLKDFKP